MTLLDEMVCFEYERCLEMWLDKIAGIFSLWINAIRNYGMQLWVSVSTLLWIHRPFLRMILGFPLRSWSLILSVRIRREFDKFEYRHPVHNKQSCFFNTGLLAFFWILDIRTWYVRLLLCFFVSRTYLIKIFFSSWQFWQFTTSVADAGCFSRIPDPHQRI